jgi:hypothetical protein
MLKEVTVVKKLVVVDENGPVRGSIMPTGWYATGWSSSSKIHTHSTKPKVGIFCYFTKKLPPGGVGRGLLSEGPIQNYCSDTTPIRLPII